MTYHILPSDDETTYVCTEDAMGVVRGYELEHIEYDQYGNQCVEYVGRFEPHVDDRPALPVFTDFEKVNFTDTEPPRSLLAFLEANGVIVKAF